MKKTAFMLVALGAVVALTSAAWAQDSVMWYDIRPNEVDATYPDKDIAIPTYPFTNGQESGDAALNGGGQGAGSVLRIHPTCLNTWHTDEGAFPAAGFQRWPNYDGDNDASTGSLYLYIDVNDVAGDGDCIASIGVDMGLTETNVQIGGVGSNRLASIDYSWDVAYFNDVTNAGTQAGGSDAGDPPSWLGAKAVKVPVVDSGGPSYAIGADGLGAPGLYRIGQLDVVGGLRNNPAGTPGEHLANSTYSVHLSVNNLLITRVFSSGGDASESVSFGYDAAGSPELPAVDGSVETSTSTLADANIQVHMKSDSNADGKVTAGDIAVAPYGFVTVLNTGTIEDQRTIYTHDAGHDRKITASDIFPFVQTLQVGSAGCGV